MTSPVNKAEDCVVFEIASEKEAFTLTNVTNVGTEYTLSFWVKSALPGNIVIDSSDVVTSSEWVPYVHTYVASSTDLVLDFGVAGTYYIYHLQLEIGNVQTDWTVAPEDVNTEIESVRNSVSELSIETDTIRANVSNVSNDLDITKKDVSELLIKSDEISASVGSLGGSVKDVSDELAAIKLTSDKFAVEINRINTDGVSRVSTTTGVFDDVGLTIDRTDSPTKTQITPGGMTVYEQDANGVLTELLKATVSDGVEATDLHARTYLKIGGRSRFENYGSNRTGCFWIGGE
jgi:hypothetical protein